MGRSLGATDAKLGSPVSLKLVKGRHNKGASHSLLTRKVEVKVAQSCLTLCDPVDYTLHGILQARILEWGVVPFSRGSSRPRDQTQVSHIAGGFFTN